MNVKHFTTIGLLIDGVTRLLLCTDKQNRFAGRNGINNKIISRFKHSHGSLQVDNIDAVSGPKNKGLHFRIPAFRLVAEVDTGLKQFFHSYISHLIFLSCWFFHRHCHPCLRLSKKAPGNRSNGVGVIKIFLYNKEYSQSQPFFLKFQIKTHVRSSIGQAATRFIPFCAY